MIVAWTYICDYCHTEYNSKEECEKCESAHGKKCHILNKTYTKQSFLPQYVDIEYDSDNKSKIGRYTLSETIS